MYFRQPYFSQMVSELIRQLPEDMTRFERELSSKDWPLGEISRRLKHRFGQLVARVIQQLQFPNQESLYPQQTERLRDHRKVALVHKAAQLLERIGHPEPAYAAYKTAHTAATTVDVDLVLKVRIAADYGSFLANQLQLPKAAAPLLREALALEEGLPQPDSLQIAFRKNNLAATLLNLRKVKEALSLLEQARETCERVAPHRVVLALIYANLFVARSRSGHAPEPDLLAQARRLLDLHGLPPDHPYRQAITRISPTSRN